MLCDFMILKNSKGINFSQENLARVVKENPSSWITQKSAKLYSRNVESFYQYSKVPDKQVSSNSRLGGKNLINLICGGIQISERE